MDSNKDKLLTLVYWKSIPDHCLLEIGNEFYDQFDLIIITIGVLCWFKDFYAFFEKVSKCLKKDGCLIINEQHPVTNMLSRWRSEL